MHVSFYCVPFLLLMTCTVAHELVQSMDWVSMFDNFYNQYCNENLSSDHV